MSGGDMVIAAFIERWHFIRTTMVRVGAFVAGVLVLYHEVFISDSAEPLLIFLGLWLCGVPPAMFFDGLRKIGAQAQSQIGASLTGDTTGVPEDPERRRDD